MNEQKTLLTNKSQTTSREVAFSVLVQLHQALIKFTCSLPSAGSIYLQNSHDLFALEQPKSSSRPFLHPYGILSLLNLSYFTTKYKSIDTAQVPCLSSRSKVSNSLPVSSNITDNGVQVSSSPKNKQSSSTYPDYKLIQQMPNQRIKRSKHKSESCRFISKRPSCGLKLQSIITKPVSNPMFALVKFALIITTVVSINPHEAAEPTKNSEKQKKTVPATSDRHHHQSHETTLPSTSTSKPADRPKIGVRQTPDVRPKTTVRKSQALDPDQEQDMLNMPTASRQSLKNKVQSTQMTQKGAKSKQIKAQEEWQKEVQGAAAKLETQSSVISQKISAKKQSLFYGNYKQGDPITPSLMLRQPPPKFQEYREYKKGYEVLLESVLKAKAAKKTELSIILKDALSNYLDTLPEKYWQELNAEFHEQSSKNPEILLSIMKGTERDQLKRREDTEWKTHGPIIETVQKIRKKANNLMSLINSYKNAPSDEKQNYEQLLLLKLSMQSQITISRLEYFMNIRLQKYYEKAFFTYHQKSNKKAVMKIDSLVEKVIAAGNNFHEYLEAAKQLSMFMASLSPGNFEILLRWSQGKYNYRQVFQKSYQTVKTWFSRDFLSTPTTEGRIRVYKEMAGYLEEFDPYRLSMVDSEGEIFRQKFQHDFQLLNDLPLSITDMELKEQNYNQYLKDFIIINQMHYFDLEQNQITSTVKIRNQLMRMKNPNHPDLQRTPQQRRTINLLHCIFQLFKQFNNPSLAGFDRELTKTVIINTIQNFPPELQKVFNLAFGTDTKSFIAALASKNVQTIPLSGDEATTAKISTLEAQVSLEIEMRQREGRTHGEQILTGTIYLSILKETPQPFIAIMGESSIQNLVSGFENKLSASMAASSLFQEMMQVKARIEIFQNAIQNLPRNAQQLNPRATSAKLKADTARLKDELFKTQGKSLKSDIFSMTEDQFFLLQNDNGLMQKMKSLNLFSVPQTILTFRKQILSKAREMAEKVTFQNVRDLVELYLQFKLLDKPARDEIISFYAPKSIKSLIFEKVEARYPGVSEVFPLFLSKIKCLNYLHGTFNKILDFKTSSKSSLSVVNLQQLLSKVFRQIPLQNINDQELLSNINNIKANIKVSSKAKIVQSLFVQRQLAIMNYFRYLLREYETCFFDPSREETQALAQTLMEVSGKKKEEDIQIFNNKAFVKYKTFKLFNARLAAERILNFLQHLKGNFYADSILRASRLDDTSLEHLKAHLSADKLVSFSADQPSSIKSILAYIKSIVLINNYLEKTNLQTHSQLIEHISQLSLEEREILFESVHINYYTWVSEQERFIKDEFQSKPKQYEPLSTEPNEAFAQTVQRLANNDNPKQADQYLKKLQQFLVNPFPQGMAPYKFFLSYQDAQKLIVFFKKNKAKGRTHRARVTLLKIFYWINSSHSNMKLMKWFLDSCSPSQISFLERSTRIFLLPWKTAAQQSVMFQLNEKQISVKRMIENIINQRCGIIGTEEVIRIVEEDIVLIENEELETVLPEIKAQLTESARIEVFQEKGKVVPPRQHPSKVFKRQMSQSLIKIPQSRRKVAVQQLEIKLMELGVANNIVSDWRNSEGAFKKPLQPKKVKFNKQLVEYEPTPEP